MRGELAELEEVAPALPAVEEIVKHIRGRVLPLIQTGKLTDLKKILQSFVSKIIVNTEKIMVTYSFELCGIMPERTIIVYICSSLMGCCFLLPFLKLYNKIISKGTGGLFLWYYRAYNIPTIN